MHKNKTYTLFVKTCFLGIKEHVPNRLTSHFSSPSAVENFSEDMDNSARLRSADGVITITESNAARLPINEMLDDNYVLRHHLNSAFLNRFFSADESSACETTAVTEEEEKKPNIHDEQTDKPKTVKASKKTEIRYHMYGGDFKIESFKDRLRATNTRPIRLFERSRNLSLGIKIYIPAKFIGLTNCFQPPGCICVTDIVSSGDMDVRVQLVNITSTPLEVPAGTLQIYIHVLPQIPPEPWQTMNMSEPHVEDAYYDLRVRRAVTIKPHSTKYLTFDAAHLCPETRQSAVIIPCRHMTFRKLIVEPSVWQSHVMPVVRIINACQTTLHIPPGTPVAKVLFTSPGIIPVTPALTSIIKSLEIPKINVIFSRMSHPPRHNK